MLDFMVGAIFTIIIYLGLKSLIYFFLRLKMQTYFTDFLCSVHKQSIQYTFEDFTYVDSIQKYAVKATLLHLVFIKEVSEAVKQLRAEMNTSLIIGTVGKRLIKVMMCKHFLAYTCLFIKLVIKNIKQKETNIINIKLFQEKFAELIYLGIANEIYHEQILANKGGKHGKKEPSS